MHHAEARIATEKAGRYLSQLCKHWAHKFPVTHDAARGRIEFETGACRLEAAADHLLLHVEARDEAALLRLEEVVQRHLERFAFREALGISWARLPQPVAPG